MTYTLANIIFIVCAVVGLAGSIIPGLPGTPIIFLGCLAHALLTGFQPLGAFDLVLLGVLVGAAVAGDLLMAAWGVKRFGGTKWGALGALVGLVAGLVFIPLPGGFLIGCFLGALAGELLFARRTYQAAALAGVGATLGTIVSVVVRFGVAAAMIIYATVRIW